MKILLLTFDIFIIVILSMVVGYIFSEHTIKGSCGGISSLGMKKMYDCDTLCDTLQKELGKKQHSGNQGIEVDHQVFVECLFMTRGCLSPIRPSEK